MAEDHDADFRPATREEVVDGLSFALRLRGGRQRSGADAKGFLDRLAAEAMLDQLCLRGFVVMRRPTAAAAQGGAAARDRGLSPEG